VLHAALLFEGVKRRPYPVLDPLFGQALALQVGDIGIELDGRASSAALGVSRSIS